MAEEAEAEDFGARLDRLAAEKKARERPEDQAKKFYPGAQPGVEEDRRDDGPAVEEILETAETADGDEAEEVTGREIANRVWRLAGALKFIEVRPEYLEGVRAVLWWASRGKDAGKEAFRRWAGQELEWPDKDPGRVVGWNAELIYRMAQAKGWRYPVFVSHNRLAGMVETAEAAMVRGGAKVYEFDQGLVRPVEVEKEASKGRKTKVVLLEPLSPPWLKSEMTRYVDWRKDRDNPVGVPGDVVQTLLARGSGRQRFEKIAGVITCPTLRPDGSVLSKAGVDAATRLLMVGNVAMPEVKERPSERDARVALGMLEELVEEFPFVDEASRAVALSALITPVVRAICECVPLHGVTAPKPGSGKSFLLDTVSMIATGNYMPVHAAGARMEEANKRIDTCIIAGQGLFSIDNVQVRLGGDTLCQAIERPEIQIRLLGRNDENVVRRNRWSIFATGNNLILVDDLVRRCVICRMDAGVEQPEEKKFRGNPVVKVMAQRGSYVWAALTLVRAYIVAGRPGAVKMTDPFDGWSENVRSALLWLGCADPVVTQVAARGRDPRRQIHAALLQAWADTYGLGIENARKAGVVAEDVEEGSIKPVKGPRPGGLDGMVAPPAELDRLRMVLREMAGKYRETIETRWFGKQLEGFRGAIVDGLVLRSETDRHEKVQVWWVEKG